MKGPVAGFVFACLLFASAAAAADVAGHWHGTISLPDSPVGIKLTLWQTGDRWAGTIDLPFASANGLPLDSVHVDGADVQFAIASVSGVPAFAGKLHDDAIDGTFTQGSVSVPFHLTRGQFAATTSAVVASQPAPPYDQRDVQFTSGTVTIAGTLTVPRGPGPFPAAVLVSGSGPNDRDENVFGHRIFFVIADRLTCAGIAVLRDDKRGIGGSTGSINGATTEDFAGDTLGAVAFLKTQPHIDARRIGLIGHSEGGMIAPIAADRSSDVAFVVLLSAPGVPIDALMRRQSYLILKASGGDEATLQTLDHRLAELFALVISRAPASELIAKSRQVIEIENSLAPPDRRLGQVKIGIAAAESAWQTSTTWFRFFIAYDPRPALRHLRQPVLVLAGDRDLQVPAEQNIPEITQALKQSDNRDVTIRVLPGLNHLYQHTKTGSPDEYAASPDTFNDDALKIICDWITQRFGPTTKP